MLLLTLPAPAELQIGRNRTISFQVGLYCYVGSALGPGGLAARLGRYASGTGRRHWHIDYLLPQAQLTGALVIEDPHKLECSWAAWVGDQARACVQGFGSSDCRCAGHLFLLGVPAEGVMFVERARRELHARWVSCEDLISLVTQATRS